MKFKDQPTVALRDPLDANWGLCPKCKQSAQAKAGDKLVCYRCSLVFPRRRWVDDAGY